MELSSAGRELVWLELQRGNRVRARIERRAWVTHFVLAIVLIAFTVGVAMVLGRLSGEIIRPLGSPVPVHAGWALRCVRS